MQRESKVRFVLRAGAALLAVSCLPAICHAAVSQWNTDSGGNFSDPGNWDSGVPGVADTAMFSRGDVAYTVDFTGDAVTDLLRIERNCVTFLSSLNGSYTVIDSDPTHTVATSIGASATGSAVLNSYLSNFSTYSLSVAAAGTLNIQSGTVNITGIPGPGSYALSSGGAINVLNAATLNCSQSTFIGGGKVTVSGTGSTWNNSMQSIFGYGADAELWVTNSGHVNSASAQLTLPLGLSPGFTSSAHAYVDGAGSTWNCSGSVVVGQGPGEACLAISNGGVVRDATGIVCTSNLLFVSQNSAPLVDTVTVDGPGSAWISSDLLSVGNFSSTSNVPDTSAALTITNGGLVTCTDGRIYSSRYRSVTSVVVDGPGSALIASKSLSVTGLIPSHTQLIIRNGARLATGGSLFTTDDVIVTGGGSKLEVGGEFNVQSNGNLSVSGGAQATSKTGYINSHDSSLPARDLEIIGLNSVYKVTDTIEVYSDLHLTVTGDSQFIVGSLFHLYSGRLFGNARITGNIESVNGTVAPGDSLGSFAVLGNYRQILSSLGVPSKLEIEIGGRDAGTSYDQLLVSGTATLGGTLNVLLVNGFMPAPGDSFDILDWGTLSGTFSTLQLPALGNSFGWDTSQLYTNGTISVTTVPEPASFILLAMTAPLWLLARRQLRCFKPGSA